MTKRPTKEMFDIDHCFVCEGPRDVTLERPGDWFVSRTTCGEHARMAVLPGGETVRAFMKRAGPDADRMDGPGLSSLINPVEIDCKRAWLYFNWGGVLVLEEIFDSRSFSEYMLQHHPDRLDTLYEIYSKHRDRSGALTVLQRVFRYNVMVDYLVADWTQQQSLNRALEQSGRHFPEGPDQVHELLCSVKTPVWSNWIRWVFTNIDATFLEIAERRFSHI